MPSCRMMFTILLSVTAIAPIAADEIIRQRDDDLKNSSAIRELVRLGAVVKRFAVTESDTAGLLVRLKSEHLDQHGQIITEILTELSSLKDLALGDAVIKYGVDIGKVVQPIATGQHAHVHNIKTKRW